MKVAMKFLQKAVPLIFIIVFTYITILLYFFSHLQYMTKVSFIIPNIFALIFIIIVFILFFKAKENKDISLKKFITLIATISITSYFAQLFIAKFCIFSTGWDAGLIERNIDYFITNGKLLDPEYMTRCPNNLFIEFILIMIKKLPIIGGRKATLLAVNCLIVNISCLFACLTINNITKNKKLALSSYLVMVPLIILSPWILVLYSDSFGIIFPILVIYLYTRENKGNLELFLIILFSIIGYFIKPTAIIVLMAICIVEIFTLKKEKFKKLNIKKLALSISIILLAILLSFGSRKLASSYLRFKPVAGVHEFTMVHYLVLGQSDKSDGVFNDDDYHYSVKNGMKNNFNRFWTRLTSRTPLEQLQFFSRKTLVNFNNGSFSWGVEGTFYDYVKPTTSKLQSTMRSIFYTPGKYYKYLLQFEHWLWLLVLFFCPFIVKKSNNKNELVIMLSILGVTAFLTIFESRTRYLYCYAPVFVTCATLGIYNLKRKIKGKLNKENGGSNEKKSSLL